MNNLFSEIYGCYYKVVEEIIKNSPVTEDEIRKIVKQCGYEETCFHFFPLLNKLPFLEKKGDKYYSTLEISEQKKNFSFPLTNIEKSWLKSIVQDERFPLFVNGKTYENIVKKLSDIEPLYDEKMFRYYDQYADGDEYKNKYYIKNFRILSDATDKKIPVKIIYQSTKKNKISVGHYIPIKLEYSQKDDKFRVYTIKISDGKRLDSVCLNIGRIIEVKPSNKTYKGKIDVELDMKIFERLEHAEIEIYNERNAIERFMIEFSTYEKSSELDEENNICRTKIYYHKKDETEILIKLLSFGPTLKVISPDRFVELIKYRIDRQYDMVKGKLFWG